MGLSSKYRPLFMVAAFLLVLVVGLGLLKGRLERNIEIRESLLDTRAPTPLVSIKLRTPNPHPLSAFIVHGFQCNKGMMVPLGKYLALNGINSYLIDLPGHGSSCARYSEEACHDIGREALQRLIDVEKLDPAGVALIGHSLGANIVARIGLTDARFKSHVLIGPGFEPGLTPAAPANALFVVGESDYPFVREAARRMLLAATGERVDRGGISYGSLESFDARLLWVAPGVGHVGLIYDREVYREIREWVIHSLSDRDSPANRLSGASPLSINAALALGVVALASVAGLGVVRAAFRERQSASLFVCTNPLFEFLILVAAWLFSLNILRFSVPLRFLSLQEGDVIASLLFLCGLLGVAGWFAFRRKLEVQSLRGAIRTIGAAIAIASVYYIAAMISISSEFYQLTLGPPRIWRFAAIAVSILPFFLVTEAVFRGIQERGDRVIARNLRAFSIGVAYFAIVTLSVIIRDVQLIRFFPFMVAVAAGLQALSCVLYEAARVTLLTAVLQTLMVAWILSAGFVLC